MTHNRQAGPCIATCREALSAASAGQSTRWSAALRRGAVLRGIGVGLALPILLAAVGCGGGPGVRWQGPSYRDAEAVAERTGQLVFVYFRSWYMVDCTKFEEQILKDSEVLAETQDLVCVALDFDYDRALARQWQLDDRPAYVIVDPDEQVLARDQTPITREELLRGMRAAKEAFAGSQGAPAGGNAGAP